MITDISFIEENNKYISGAIQLGGDAGIHLEFPETDNKVNKDLFVQLQQSMTGDKFVPFDTEWIKGEYVYDKAIQGVLPEMYVQIVCNQKPSVAKLLTE